MMANAWRDYLKTQQLCPDLCANMRLSERQMFKRACAVRMCEALIQRCNRAEPGAWSCKVEMNEASGACTLLVQCRGMTCATCCVDQVKMEAGAVDKGMAYYCGEQGRMCPDITFMMGPAGQAARSAMICECRCEDQRQDAMDGYRQACLYRHEYAAVLCMTPKVCMVTCHQLSGAMNAQHDVMACCWSDWCSEAVCASMDKEMRRCMAAQMKKFA